MYNVALYLFRFVKFNLNYEIYLFQNGGYLINVIFKKVRYLCNIIQAKLRLDCLIKGRVTVAASMIEVLNYSKLQ